MTQQEYASKVKCLENKLAKEVFELQKELCRTMMEEKGIKLGSILVSNMGTSRVLRTKVGIKIDKQIEPIYICELLKKDGSKRARYEEEYVYHSNVLEVRE